MFGSGIKPGLAHGIRLLLERRLTLRAGNRYDPAAAGPFLQVFAHAPSEITRQRGKLLGQGREHWGVVGSDEVPVGTVDMVRGDRNTLSKHDSEDGQHHSLTCHLVDRIEGDRVILDKPAEEAKRQFSNEDRDRALFERDDEREPGPHMLNRSFSGTY